MRSTNAAVFNNAGTRILSHESTVDVWTAQYFEHQKERLTEDLNILERYASPKSTRIVEVGSSPPFLTAAMNDLGYDVVGLGVDPNRFSEAIRIEGLDIRAANIESEPFPVASESVDLVLMNRGVRTPSHSNFSDQRN